MIENAATSSPAPACSAAGVVFDSHSAHTNHNSEITRRLAHEYIEKLASFSVETADQGTAAIILREYIRRLENTVSAQQASIRAYQAFTQDRQSPRSSPSSSVETGG